MDEKAIASWKNYVLQSLAATLSVFVVFLVLELGNAVVVASIGATAFIVFAMPKSVPARPRNSSVGTLVLAAIQKLLKPYIKDLV